MGSFLASLVLDSVFGKTISKVLTFGVPVISIVVYVFFKGRKSQRGSTTAKRLKSIQTKQRTERHVERYTEGNPEALAELLAGRGYERLRKAR